MVKLNKLLDMIIVGSIALLLGLVQIPHKEIDKEFQSYYSEFKKLTEIGCDKPILRTPGRLDINFTQDLIDTTVGQCRVFVNTAEIKIDSFYWEYTEPDKRYQVIMHELTHCLLGSWYTAKFPFHISNKNHYMFWQVTNLTIPEIQEQIIQVARDECNE